MSLPIGPGDRVGADTTILLVVVSASLMEPLLPAESLFASRQIPFIGELP